MLGQPDFHGQKRKRPSLWRIQLKMDQRPKHKSKKYKLLEENIAANLLDHTVGTNFLSMTMKTQATIKTQLNWTSSKLKNFSKFYWSVVDLPCCISFRWPAKWIGYTHTPNTDIYIYPFFFSHIGYYRLWTRVP